MKNLKPMLVIAIMVAFTSCKNTEKGKVETAVDDYTTHIDSISNIALEDASLQWDEIENTVNDRKNAAENEIQTLTNKSQYEQRMEKSSKKYEAFKKDVLTERQKSQAIDSEQSLRNSLFKDTYMGDDLNFSWVNKTNILNAYDYFVTTVTTNKDSYSKEEWDEIKRLYEALDNQKNVVEKEGLTTSDNLKIAELKARFAPMLKINQFGAESEEDKKAKK